MSYTWALNISTKAWWRIYPSADYVIIGSGDGMPPGTDQLPDQPQLVANYTLPNKLR